PMAQSLNHSIRIQHRDRLTRDDQLLVRWDGPDFCARFDAADLLFLRPHLVLAVVEDDAGPFEVAADRLADGDPVLANPASEGEDVATAEHHQIRAHIVTDALDEGVDGKFGAGSPRTRIRGRDLLDVAQVGRDAAHAEHATFFAQLPED